MQAREEAIQQQKIGHELTEYARGLIAIELNKSRAFTKTYLGMSGGEHQFKVINNFGYEFDVKITADGKVYCPCGFQLEYRLPCRHLCVCIGHLQRIDPRFANVDVFNSLWAAPFWSVEIYLRSHERRARSHAVHPMHLLQRQLLPPVSEKAIGDGRGRCSRKKKRYASRGEEGRRIVRKSNNEETACSKCGGLGHHRQQCRAVSTKMIVQNSSTFQQLSEEGIFRPVDVNIDMQAEDEGNDITANIWHAIVNNEKERTTQRTEQAGLEDVSAFSEQLSHYREEVTALRRKVAILEEKNRILRLKVSAYQDTAKIVSNNVNKSSIQQDAGTTCQLCTWQNVPGELTCHFCGSDLGDTEAQ